MAERDASQHHAEVKIEEVEIPEDSNVAERMEKYNRYKADYARWIKAKYFSKKAPNGGELHALTNVFEKETSIDDEIIKSSRVPCTKLFIESINNMEDGSKLLGSGAEAAASTPPRKTLSKKAN